MEFDPKKYTHNGPRIYKVESCARCPFSKKHKEHDGMRWSCMFDSSYGGDGTPAYGRVSKECLLHQGILFELSDGYGG